ncbi:MAG: type II toxin-antitoxin system VapC family toxin [Rhodospirillales bacterium]|nr:type II toxin-antitoxin system VapC family toxin [Rhodospirillales bacterium]
MSADRLVVDASVGLKWVIDEAGSDEAVQLLDVGRQLLAPALFWVEAANALATKVRKGELSQASANDAWRDLSEAPIETLALTPESLSLALALAHDLRHPVYDCCYLAAAIAHDCQVATADRRFIEAASAHPNLAKRVKMVA